MPQSKTPNAGIRRPVVIGIVGGVGAGKSRVAREFERAGVPVFDADTNAKSHLADPAVVARIRDAFGEGVIDAASGGIDRAALAGVVFSDRTKLDELEAILHPLVLRDQHAFIERAGVDGAKAVVIDAPLLLEAGFGEICDRIVFVEASEETRFGRVSGARGWSREELERRESSQWPLERKRSRADDIVHNDGVDSELAPQIARILATMST